MRILYITSGHKRIYSYIDRCIVTYFQKLSIPVKTFHPFDTLAKLQGIIQSFRPTLVLTVNGDKISKGKIIYLKNTNIERAVWLTEDPYYIDRSQHLIKDYQYVFTIDKAAELYYKKLGFQKTYHLPLGTDTQTFKPIQVNEKHKTQICMVGFPYKNRIQIIKRILTETPYNVTVVGRWKDVFEPHILKNRRLSIYNGWFEPKIVSTFYNGAYININTLRPFDEDKNENHTGIKNKSVNNRIFDISACNAFQLMQNADDLYEYFSEDEIVTFSDEGDLINKIYTYIKNKDETASYSMKAYKKTTENHTFENRLKTIISCIDSGKTKHL